MRIRLGLLLALAASSAGCDVAAGGALRFDEIDVAAAAQLVGTATALLVQVRESDSPDPRVPDAAIVGPDEPVPPSWRSGGRPIVILAHDGVAARRLAARLVREGVARVSVVRGGIEAWTGTREEPAGPASTARRSSEAGQT